MFLFAALIISLELAIGVFSTQPLHHAAFNSRVLADEITASQEPAPSDNPSDSILIQVDTTPSQEESVNPSPTESVSQPGENAGTPSENNSLQAGAPGQEEKPSENPAIEKSTIPAVNFLDNAIFQDKAQENIASVLTQETVNEVNQEEQQLEQAATAQEQAAVLLQNAENNVNLLETNLKKNDFDDVSFNAVRLNDQIDKALDAIQQLPPIEAAQLRAKIETVCKNTEYVLRSNQLVVPEDVEESLEITRGTCMAIQQ